MDIAEAIRYLVEERGAHFVPTWIKVDSEGNKDTRHWKWKQGEATRPTTEQVLKALKGKYNTLGLVVSTLGIMTVDVDKGNPDEIPPIVGQPMIRLKSRRKDGEHLHYPDDNPQGRKYRWLLPSGTEGDLQRGNNLAFIHHLEDLPNFAEAVKNMPTAPSIPYSNGLPEKPLIPQVQPMSNGKMSIADAMVSGISGGTEHIDKGLVEGNRNNFLNAAVFKAAATIPSDKDLLVEVDRLVRKALAAGANSKEVEATVVSAGTAGRQKYYDSLKQEKAKECLGTEYTRENFAAAVTGVGAELRLNTLSASVEINRGKGWGGLNDRAEGALLEDIHSKYCLQTKTAGMKSYNPPPIIYQRILNAHLDTHQVNPFLEWLDNMPKWDGIKRVETLLHDMFGADPNCPFVKWVSVNLFTACIKRNRQPGCQCDQTPVLISEEQGVGKSTLLQFMFPKNEGWYGGRFNLNDPTQKQVESLLGKVMVEISEEGGRRKTDIEKIKTILTITNNTQTCLLYTSPSPRDRQKSRMPSSA